MPTESTFLFAGLLFLAAALGYVFARFGDDDDAPGEGADRAGILKGFRYLLDEEPDRAADVITSLDDRSEEGVETQIALGGLFRRRGQLDRAIRLHQDLLDQPGVSAVQRNRAAFALAEDFLSAGLFDRAEELLLRLRDSRDLGAEALRRLLRVCEVTSDWSRAIDLGGGLARVSPGSLPASQLAHYHCELAEVARRQKDYINAGRCLDLAEALEPNKPRTGVIRGDLAADQGQYREAAERYAAVARAAPGLLGDLLSRLVAAVHAAGGPGEVRRALADLSATPEGLRGLAQAVIRDPAIADPALLDCLATYVQEHPVLAELTDGEGLKAAAPEQRYAALERLRRGLHKLAAGSPPHQCANCGYVSAGLVWQCPGCRSWDTVQTSDRLLFKGSPV